MSHSVSGPQRSPLIRRFAVAVKYYGNYVLYDTYLRYSCGTGSQLLLAFLVSEVLISAHS